MAISDKNTSFSIVLNKGLKHKLQILSESEKRSLGSYISNILEQHVIEFEENIYESVKKEDFNKAFKEIFGDEYPPYYFNPDTKVSFNIQDVKSKFGEIKRGAQRTTSTVRQIRNDNLDNGKTPTE